MARERPHIRLRVRRAARPPLHHHAPLQAPTQAGGPTPDTFPRSQAHVRHPAAHKEHQPQGRLGNVGACNHSHHASHLLACPAQHARERRRCDGGCPYLERGGVKSTRCDHTGCSSYSVRFMLICRGFLEYRRSGSNRHGAFAPPDFEPSRFVHTCFQLLGNLLI